MTKRFTNRLDKSNKKFNTLNPVWDNENMKALNVFEMIDWMNFQSEKVNRIHEFVIALRDLYGGKRLKKPIKINYDDDAPFNYGAVSPNVAMICKNDTQLDISEVVNILNEQFKTIKKLKAESKKQELKIKMLEQVKPISELPKSINVVVKK